MDNQNQSQPSITVNTTKNNFGDGIRSNWQIITTTGLIALAIIGMYYDMKVVKAQSIENKTDIRSLESRMSSVEGDIKAMRQGIDYLVSEKKKHD